jgi:hypothetical protein
VERGAEAVGESFKVSEFQDFKGLGGSLLLGFPQDHVLQKVKKPLPAGRGFF